MTRPTPRHRDPVGFLERLVRRCGCPPEQRARYVRFARDLDRDILNAMAFKVFNVGLG